MPCRYDETPEDIAAPLREKARRRLKIIHGLTQHLCALCTHLEAHGIEIKPAEVSQWWIQHKIADAKRQKRG
jgi:isochorismate hydrolase